MSLKAWGVSVVLAGAVAVGGITLPNAAGAAMPLGAAGSPAVSGQSVEGQVGIARSAGVFPTKECLAKLEFFWLAGYPNAYCAWHPPLQFGYEELFY